jgi:predicted nucleic acid-binding protein
LDLPVRVPAAVLAETYRGTGADALVIATAIRLGGGIVATGDPDDLRSLARDQRNVKVEGVN